MFRRERTLKYFNIRFIVCGQGWTGHSTCTVENSHCNSQLLNDFGNVCQCVILFEATLVDPGISACWAFIMLSLDVLVNASFAKIVLARSVSWGYKELETDRALAFLNEL